MADFAPGDGVERLAELGQVHGRDVVPVGPDGPRHDVHGHLHGIGDGLVTAEPGVTLSVRAADCVPVLFADIEAGVIGACHCGRPGVVAGIVPATVAAMRELGAAAITAWVGPHVCGRCYEVPRADAGRPSPRSSRPPGPPRRGAPRRSTSGPASWPSSSARASSVVDLSRCTMESPDLFSYRREGKRSGRQAGLVRIVRMSTPMSRRAELAAGLDDVRRRIAAAARGGRARPGRGDPGRGDEVLPGLRRPAPRRARRDRRRREPPPRGRRQARRVRRPRPALALHRRSPEQQGRRRRLLRRRRRVGRPGQARRRPRPWRPRALPRGRRPAAGQPRPAGSRRAARAPTPTTSTALADAVEGAGDAPAARADGGRAARRGPSRGLRSAGRTCTRRSSAGRPRRRGSRPG